MEDNFWAHNGTMHGSKTHSRRVSQLNSFEESSCSSEEEEEEDEMCEYLCSQGPVATTDMFSKDEEERAKLVC